MQQLSVPKKLLLQKDIVATGTMTVVVSAAMGAAYGTGVLTLAPGFLPSCMALAEVAAIAVGGPMMITGLMLLAVDRTRGVKRMLIGAAFLSLGLIPSNVVPSNQWSPAPADTIVHDYSV